ncbi:alpha/beta fold hydrolase [Haladaptatus sp. NG-SE-30]
MPTVRTNDIDTYYEQRGDGPPLVFVHASILDHSMWNQQVDALSEHYTTIVYDLRGHGRTGGSTESEYSMNLYAEDLHALITALELDRPILCGLSMGGTVALTYAARFPDRIAGLILAETFTPEILTRGEWFLFQIVYRAIVPSVRLVGYERIEKVNMWLTERFFSGSSGDYENVERLRETGPKMTTDEFVKVIRSMMRSHEMPLEPSAVTVPTLVLYGENELPFIKCHAAELAAHISDVEVDEVPDAGHASNLDNPDYFTTAVRTFLARSTRPDEPTPS